MTMIFVPYRKTARAAILAALTMLCLAPAAQAVPKWVFPLTVNGYAGASALADFPVLVRISPARVSGFAYANCAADGRDLAFWLPDGTPLAREIDTWNPQGESLVWVRVPSLTNDLVFACTYGDPSVTAQPACQTDGSVWTQADYIGVWHMNESSGAVADATGHGLTATPVGNTANSVAFPAGAVGTARQTATSAAKGSLSIPSYDSHAVGSTFTMSGWVRLSAAGASAHPRLFSRKAYYKDLNGWESVMPPSSFTGFNANGSSSAAVAGDFPTSLQNNWALITFVYNGTTLSVYQNGALVKSGTIAAATDNGQPLAIGNDADGDDPGYVSGAFDECRLRRGAASADWVAASYATQSSASSFLACGAVGYVFGDDVLEVSGNPVGIGAPTPGFGVLRGLAAGDTVSLSMPVTSVPGPETTTYKLSGWRIYAVDPDTGDKTLLRSSTDTGEVFDACTYTHAARAEFQWLWEARTYSAATRWSFPVTVSGYAGSAPLTDFPVLVRISPDRAPGFSYADCADDGRDLSFRLPDGTTLDREIDTWNPQGESLVWVRIPSLTNGLAFACAYGDPAIAAQPASQTDGSVWTNAGYIGVWHMNEPSGAVADATGHGLVATPAGNTANSVAFPAGAVGTARQTATSAAKGYLSIPSYDSHAAGSTFTMSGWVRLTAAGAAKAYPRLFSRKEGYQYAGWEIAMIPQSFTGFSANGNTSSAVGGNFPTGLQNTWSLITLVYSGTTLSIYQNGAFVKSGTVAAPTDNGKPLSIGCNSNGSEHNAVGAFDECRLRRGAASADWVAASHATQSSASFLAYGTVGCAFGDDVLEVGSDPAGVGAPAPDYGVLRGLDAGDTVSLSMAVTNVPGEGGILHRLTGWRLYAVDRGTGDKTLLRSSEDAGEAVDACAYVHASRAEFQWLWRTFNALAVQAPVVDSTADSTADVSVTVGGIGYTAASATLAVLYGNMPTRLAFTNVVATALVNPETFTATLTRLNPSQTYYAKAILETDTGERVESAIVSFTTTAAPDEFARPGLWQTFFTAANADWTKDIWAVPAGTNWLDYADGNRIRRLELMPIGAYVGGTPPSPAPRTSALWGDAVYWPTNGGQWVYAGRIHLDAGKAYKFRTKIDDNERIVITDAKTGVATTLVEDKAGGNTQLTSAAYTPSATGWHAIEIRLSDNLYGAGGYDASNGYLNSVNLGYSEDNGATWSILADPGDGSLLSGSCEPGITATESFAEGQLQAIDFTFEPGATDRNLYAAYGPVHGGNDPAGWTYTKLLGTIAAGATDYNYLIPADWGSDSNLVVRFYFGDGLADWSESFYWRDYTVPVTAPSAPAMLDTRTRTTLAPATLIALDTRSFTEAWSIRPVYATQTTPVPVPYAWLDGYEGLVVGGDYETAAHATAANGVNKVWECYVLGLNPTAAADFFLVDIAVAEGNAVISWSPDLGASRVYTIEAADTPNGPTWTEVENTVPTPGHPRRFFRVKAALP